MPRVTLLSEIWRMLDACAHGFTKRETKHYWIVTWNGRSYREQTQGSLSTLSRSELVAGSSLLHHLQPQVELEHDVGGLLLGRLLPEILHLAGGRAVARGEELEDRSDQGFPVEAFCALVSGQPAAPCFALAPR